MADQNSEFGSFLAGFFIGSLAGAAAALLLAPQSGEETRTLIREKSIELKDKAAMTAEETRDRADKLIEETRDRALSAIEEARVKAVAVLEEQKAKLSAMTSKSQGTKSA